MSVKARRILLATGLLSFLALVVWPFLPAALYQVRHTISTLPVLQNVPAVRQLALPPYVAPEVTPAPQEDTLVIPTIGVSALIRQGTDISILDRVEGVWHQSGALTGNYVIAGHRFKYLPPNTQTFYNLDKVQVGDSIELWLGGKEKEYVVSQLRTVSNDDVSILNPTVTPQLLIYTCVDLTYSKRLVVIAVPHTFNLNGAEVHVAIYP
jgi:LPXTG-site transpeptidase (sortase) family protein